MTLKAFYGLAYNVPGHKMQKTQLWQTNIMAMLNGPGHFRSQRKLAEPIWRIRSRRWSQGWGVRPLRTPLCRAGRWSARSFMCSLSCHSIMYDYCSGRDANAVKCKWWCLYYYSLLGCSWSCWCSACSSSWEMLLQSTKCLFLCWTLGWTGSGCYLHHHLPWTSSWLLSGCFWTC